jgi:uncharacterized damage-inducible protein DinB
MSTIDSILEETLEAWEDARLGLIDELSNIPANRFDWRPTPHTRSVQELVIHILEVAMMMTEELNAADASFHRVSFSALVKKHGARARSLRTRNDAVKLLKTQLIDAQEKFRTSGELHMLQLIKRFDGEKGTRLAWLNHGIAQEMYHRGQLTLYQRLIGLTPHLTKRIRGG